MSRKLKTIGLMLLLGGIAGTPQAFSADLPSSVSSEQAATCKGSVVDENGDPLIGAAVVAVGANRAVSTDYDGKFDLGTLPTGTTVKVTYVGYEEKEVRWNGQPLNIVMVPADNMLNEMVVVGYGVVRKADLAGSVSVLDNKAFAAQPITQASEALQGRVAGVQVVSDGLPGGSVKIRVRGSNSINNSNEPLYIVDGMVRETGLEGINPEDIASMQVLKDASSTAIYGSRGANGVVLITTKNATKGATQITFDASIGTSEATSLPAKIGAKQYAQSLVDWFGFQATDPRIAPYINGTDPGVDWFDEMYRSGLTQNYRLVLAKGTEAAQLYISGNYMNHKGVLEGTEYERYSFKLNGKAKLTDWLDATADIQASRGESEGVGGIAMGGFGPLYVGANYSPAMHVFTEDGYYMRDPMPNNLQESPMAMLVGSQNKRYKDVFAGHIDLRFTILPELTFTTSNGVDYWNFMGFGFNPATNDPNSNKNNASNNRTTRMLLQSVNNFTYVNTFAEKHNLTATAVWEATKSSSSNLNASSAGLLTGSVGYWNLPLGTVTVSNGMTDWTLLSGVARVMYNFDNRYLLTGTFRADGSSRFQNHKWGYFPSVAAAWTISNESFWESVKPVISNFKVRTSYGIVGNQDITPYSTLATLSQTSALLGTNGNNKTWVGFWNNAIGTPELKWEKTKQFDFGFDMAFLNGRVDVSVDYYYKRTSDALLLTSSSMYLGGSSYYINAGQVMNTGFDFAINANVVQGGDWTWNTSINASVLKNEVKKMTADTPELFAGSLASIINDYWVIKEGEPIGSFYGYEWAGIDSEGYDTYYTADGKATRNPTLDDRKVLGKATPDFTLGWNNTISYKNFSLNAFFNSAFGQQRMNVLRFVMNNSVGNSPYIVSPDYFTDNGPGKTFCSPSALSDNVQMGECSKYVENANYFRCENLSLSYDLSKSITKFADIRFSVGVQNLFTITSYKGSNPASFPTADAGDRANGVDTGTYPIVRTWTFGARFNF